MGRRGPTPLPAAVHKKRGTFRADRHGGPDLPVEAPPQPKDMAPRAKAVWVALVAELRATGTLAKVDSLALRSLCESWIQYVDAGKAIEKYGLVVEEETAAENMNLKSNPAVEIQNKAWNRVFKLIREFALTPASRNGMRITPKDGEANTETDDIQRILKIRG